MPTSSETLALAVDQHQAGRLQNAERMYREILAAEPNHAVALHHLGLAVYQLGERAVGTEYIQRALHLRPDFVEAYYDLGLALHEQGRLGEAVASYRRAVELRPAFAEAHSNLGNVFQAQGKLNEAIACYRQALAIRPNLAESYNNLGLALQDGGDVEAALKCYQRALEIKPDYPEAFINLGNACKCQAKLEDAVACYRRALELQPGHAIAHDNLLYTLSFCPGYDAAAIGEEHRRWNERWARPLCPSPRAHPNDRAPARRLKIGYVSPDFKDHAQANFQLPLFTAHDHGQFEIICYADVRCPDRITARLQGTADAWRNIVGLSDERVAEMVRADGIDILVDLTMHMERNRLLVFARKPAPVQVTWLAYPGTTGLTAIDYRLTDPWLDPPGLFEPCYSEESVRLADTFWCYDPLTTEPAVNALPAAEKGYVTFGSLNNFCKVNAGVLKLWARVLKGVERSHLVLLAPEGQCRAWVLGCFQEAGIVADRIEFVGRQSRQAYLEEYQRIDLGLDTLPYNGHTTSLDALWMGVPVVTSVGQTVVGRAGLSQLTNVGLCELIAQDGDEFVRVAVELASDLGRLRQLRGELRGRMERSPLMDAPRFARSIEAAYRTMWQRWCAGYSVGI
jgi:protein O-GlcNAc transferase